ncbi:MAG: hypothetical protein NT001_01230 [Candidatus Woesearchaeota archaeon]|nr:hypothetical protein [Candidatus Woesearchaeota archaeon]
MDIPKDARIIIIEGIAGSGKTTLHDSLKKHFKSKKVYLFTEEELLMGWKHIHIPEISSLRMIFLNKLLDYIEDKMKREPDAVFILERFHISLRILEWEFGKDFEKNYSSLLSRVKRLPVHILIPVLKESQIKEKASHYERSSQWKNYLNEKLKLRGFSDLGAMYKEEQKKVLNIAKEQGISYSLID